MNHIHRLSRDLRESRYEHQALLDGLNDLVAYLNSSKFRHGSELDGYVNVSDVLLRINQAKANAALTTL